MTETVVVEPADPPSVDVRRATLVVVAAQAMLMFDLGVVTVALPAIQKALNASAVQVQVILVGYSLAYAATLIVGGRLGDAFGRRHVLRRAAVACLVVALLVMGSPSIGFIIAARILGGIAAAALTPQLLAIVQVVVAPRDRPRAFGSLAAATSVGAIGGQLLAGLLIRADLFGLGWRAVFVVEALLGLLVLLGAARWLPESRGGGGTNVDLVGAAALCAGLSLVIFPVIVGRSLGWPAWIFALPSAAVPILVWFIGHERRYAARGTPLVNLELLRARAFRVGLTAGFLFSAGSMPIMFAYMLVVQVGLGHDAFIAAVGFSAMPLAFLVVSRLASRLVVALGRRALVLGQGISTLASIVMAWTAFHRGGDLTIAQMVPALAIFGAGQGLVHPLLFSFTLSDVDSAGAGAAAGVYATAQQAGGAFGVAVLGAAFFAVLDGGSGPADHARALGWTMGTYILVVNVAVLVAVRLLPPALHLAGRSAGAVPLPALSVVASAATD